MLLTLKVPWSRTTILYLGQHLYLNRGCYTNCATNETCKCHKKYWLYKNKSQIWETLNLSLSADSKEEYFIACHVSGVRCHMLGVTYHVSPITCHPSHVTCQLSFTTAAKATAPPPGNFPTMHSRLVPNTPNPKENYYLQKSLKRQKDKSI